VPYGGQSHQRQGSHGRAMARDVSRTWLLVAFLLGEMTSRLLLFQKPGDSFFHTGFDLGGNELWSRRSSLEGHLNGNEQRQ